MATIGALRCGAPSDRNSGASPWDGARRGSGAAQLDRLIVCWVHVLPPSVDLMMVPNWPTAQTVWSSVGTKLTPNRSALVPVATEFHVWPSWVITATPPAP